MAAPKVSLKLLIDTKTSKVLFAEAGKDFVDFLFHLLSLQVGTVIRLLTKNGMLGCIANLYESVENLSDNYLQPNQSKDSVLKPKDISVIGTTNFPLLLQNTEDTPKFFRCSSNSGDFCYRRCNTVSDDSNTICINCNNRMNVKMTFVKYKASDSTKGVSNEGGIVRGMVTYMVMDDLMVTPMSTISSITMLNKFNIKEVGALKEEMVELGMAEGLKLLKASLESNRVLTSVFLQKQEA